MKKISLKKVERSPQTTELAEKLVTRENDKGGLSRLFAAFGKHTNMARQDPSETR